MLKPKSTIEKQHGFGLMKDGITNMNCILGKMPHTKLLLICLFVCICLIPEYAIVDTPVELTPAPNQISRREACSIAGKLFSEVTGIDEESFSSSKYLWLQLGDSPTISFFDLTIPAPNGYWFVELTHLWNDYLMMMYMDAGTGEILFWQIENHTDPYTIVVYENAYPAETDIGWKQAGETAESWVRSVIDLESMGLSFRGFTAAYVAKPDSNGTENGQWVISKTYTIKSDIDEENTQDKLVDQHQFLACLVNVSGENNQIIDGSVLLEENCLYENGDITSDILQEYSYSE